jgi:nicotinate phosphoribosyltransferase
MPPRRRKRTDPALFSFPVEQIRQGFYSDKYLVRARDVLRADGHAPRVTVQVSCKVAAILGGIDEAVALLKLAADDWSALAVHALYEGDRVDPWDTVMTVEGAYDQFAHLETLYIGTLARRTRVCTNARALTDAARPKPVYFFPARYEHWILQPGDGYSAYVGGVKAVSTDGQGSWFGASGLAGVPHALIAVYGGDTVTATRKFADHVGEEAQVVAVVDFENDAVRTSLEVARALGDRLWAVRLDTAENMVDRSMLQAMGTVRPTGVTPPLVWAVRNALDADDFGDVKIVVSGGFDVGRIRAFEEEGVPVDAYAVGSALHDGRFDFTADVVAVDGSPVAKVGREARPNPKLERVK